MPTAERRDEEEDGDDRHETPHCQTAAGNLTGEEPATARAGAGPVP